MTIERPVAREIEEMCERILVAFYRAMDSGDHEAALALFHPQAIWSRRNDELRTPEAFRKALGGKAPTMLGHHVVTNVVADALSADHGRFDATVLSFRSDLGQPVSMPQSPTYISAHPCRGEIRLTEDGWRLSYYAAAVPTMEIGTIGPSPGMVWG